MKKGYLFCLILLCLFITSCKGRAVKINYHVLNDVETVNYKKGDNVKLDEKVIDGYRFDGWYLDASFTKKVTTLDASSDLDLYAHLIKCYKVSQVINGNTNIITVDEGTYFLELDNPNIDGYEFKGWYYDESHRNKVSDTSLIEADVVIYALLVPVTYSVSFNTNGGSEVKTQLIEKNGTIKTINGPYKLNYIFSYWSLDEEGNEPFNVKTPVTSNLVLYANYEETSYDGLIDEYVPDVISSDITLPETTDELELYWSSSNSIYFTSNGTYNPGKTLQTVSVTLRIYAKGTTDYVEFSKDVKITPYTLPDLIPGKVVSGYTSTWYFTSYSDEVLNTVDILNYSFAYVLSNGKLSMADVANMMQKTVGQAHQHGIRAMLSIQGYGEETANFSNCAADPTLRVELAHSMVEAVEKYHLDGIDIDWEYPGSYSKREFTEDRANYTLLIQEIRKQLDELGSDYLLTAAIPAGSWGAGRFEMQKLVSYFDYFNMMSYDMENPSCGSHHAALYPSTVTNGTASGSSVKETVELWTSMGVPKNKIMPGIAFYGKHMLVNSTANNGLGSIKSTTITTKYTNAAYFKIMDGQLPNIGVTTNYAFDYSSSAPYIFRPSSKNFYTYENELSILNKCKYSLEEGLAGVMIWEIGEDTTNYLITAVAQGMERHLDGKPYVVGCSLNLNVGSTISIKTVNEVVSSSLASTLIYSLSDDSLATLNGTTLSLNQAGILKIYAGTSEDNNLYGEMEIIIS